MSVAGPIEPTVQLSGGQHAERLPSPSDPFTGPAGTKVLAFAAASALLVRLALIVLLARPRVPSKATHGCCGHASTFLRSV